MGKLLGNTSALPGTVAIADAIWDEVAGDHTVVGSTGSLLAAASSVTAAATAAAVWDEDLAAHAAAGSSGEALAASAGVATPAAIAGAVWDRQKSLSVSAGSFGRALQVAGGLSQHNHRLKSPTYDPNGRLLSATLAVYPSGEDAAADTNALASLSVAMEYDGEGNLLSLLSKE